MQQVSAAEPAAGPWHGGSAISGLAGMEKVETRAGVMLGSLTACWLLQEAEEVVGALGMSRCQLCIQTWPDQSQPQC